MRKIAFLFLFQFFIVCLSKGQYVQVGDGSYLGTLGGPFQTSINISNYATRFAYIFPRSVLGNVKHGDTITSIEFSRASGLGLNNSCNLKVYLKNTNATDFGSGVFIWSANLSGMTSVYDQVPSGDIGTSEGFQRIPFNNKVFVYDTIAGNNLQIMVEYKQSATQSEVINWYFENAGTVSGYSANQTKSITGIGFKDSLTSSSDYHPTIILNYPRYEKDIAILKLYTLGKLPVPLGNPDSVKALVRNVGKNAQTKVKIYTRLQGYNKDLDSAEFDIGFMENRFINLPSLNPKKKGLDTVFATVVDNNTTNNTSFCYRLNNENVYSYRDITLGPSPGGIGFNGLTGDFVARFYSNKSKYINQISVQFAITGRPFKIGIWDNSGSNGKPGNLLYLSDSSTTVSGNYILNLKSPVNVNGTFYVGVRQLNTSNVGFGYQDESPVRPNTFFYTSPYGTTTWTDFHPDAPFKFLIEPRIQGDTDLTVLSADFPKDSINRYTTDTIAPKATVSNIGVKHLLDSFSVTCEIRFYGKLVYKNTIRDTMTSGIKRGYTFLKSFYPKDFGEHEMWVYTSALNDQIVDNDTARRKFYVGVKKDVMVATVYDPPNNADYEYLRDTIWPTATVQNPGYDNTINFISRCRILKGNTVLYNQTQSFSLLKFGSKIISFTPYSCRDTGKLRVVFTVEMTGDAYRKNDTIIRNVIVNKSYDLGVDSFALPNKFAFYIPKTNYKPIVRLYNDGILDAAPVKVVCRITSAYSSIDYRDTIEVPVGGKNNYWTQFNRVFKPDRKGLYTLKVRVFYPGDLVLFNDSMVQNFNVGYPYDYLVKNIYYPIFKDTLNVGGGPFQPRVRIQNNGFTKNLDAPPVVCQIWRKNIMVYNDIKSTSLDTGALFDLPFSKTFNPINAGEYDMIVFSNYVSDVYRKNDTMRSKFYVVTGRDAFVSSIQKPLNNQVFENRKDTVWLAATMENAGRLKMTKVSINAEIFYNNVSIYFDKREDSIGALSSKNWAFVKPFLPKDTGWYKLLVYTYSDQDQNIFNDTMVQWFRARKSEDAIVSSWLDPLPGSVILHNSGNRLPGVKVKQLGEDTSLSIAGSVYFDISTFAGNTTLYADTVLFSGLKAAQELEVFANTSWLFNTPGFYKARAIVKTGDFYPENDTLLTDFEVRLNAVRGIKAQSLLLYPNPANDVIHVGGLVKIDKAMAYDALGRQTILVVNGSNSLDVRDLSPGSYILQLNSDQVSYYIRFVKE